MLGIGMGISPVLQSVSLGSFSPSDISGLQLWLDASDITTLWQDAAGTTPVTSDGDVVGKWDDKSGNNRNATQATTSKKGIYKVNVQNGNSIVRVDGADDWMNLDGGGDDIKSIFVVTKNDNVFSAATVSVEYLFDPNSNSAGGSGIAFGTATGDLANEIITVLENVAPRYRSAWADAVATISSDFHLYTVIQDINEHDIFIDQVQRNNITSGLIRSLVFSAGGFLAAVQPGTATFAGDLCEYLFYDSILSNDNIASIETYLNDKWAIF